MGHSLAEVLVGNTRRAPLTEQEKEEWLRRTNERATQDLSRLIQSGSLPGVTGGEPINGSITSLPEQADEDERET